MIFIVKLYKLSWFLNENFELPAGMKYFYYKNIENCLKKNQRSLYQ